MLVGINYDEKAKRHECMIKNIVNRIRDEFEKKRNPDISMKVSDWRLMLGFLLCILDKKKGK